MKKTVLQFTTIMMMMGLSFSAHAVIQDADVTMKNAQGDAGYVYNSTTRTVSGCFFKPIAGAGSNTSAYVNDFEVSLCLVSCNASGITTPGAHLYKAISYVVQGLQQTQFASFSNKGFVIANLGAFTPPPGTYRLMVWINSNGGVASPPDDTTNNKFVIKDTNFNTDVSSIITVPNATGIEQISNTLNSVSVFPNPISAASALSFTTIKEEEVNVTVYNVTGQLVKTLVNGTLAAGNHVFVLNGEDFTPGLYFAAITTKEGIVTQKFAKQ